MEHLLLIFASVTAQYHLPSNLLLSLCTIESQLNVNAYHKDDGSHNSVGVCQLSPDTARSLGYRGAEKDLYAPELNIHYAGLYLYNQLHRYSGDHSAGIAAYNSGTLRLNHYGQIKNRQYVEKVMKEWSLRQSQLPTTSLPKSSGGALE